LVSVKSWEKDPKLELLMGQIKTKPGQKIKNSRGADVAAMKRLAGGHTGFRDGNPGIR